MTADTALQALGTMHSIGWLTHQEKLRNIFRGCDGTENQDYIGAKFLYELKYKVIPSLYDNFPTIFSEVLENVPHDHKNRRITVIWHLHGQLAAFIDGKLEFTQLHTMVS